MSKHDQEGVFKVAWYIICKFQQINVSTFVMPADLVMLWKTFPMHSGNRDTLLNHSFPVVCLQLRGQGKAGGSLH